MMFIMNTTFLLLLIIFCQYIHIYSELDEKYKSIDLYQVLGLTKQASITDIKRAYRQLAKKYHPDKNKNQNDTTIELFHNITNAYDILSNKQLRKEYDILFSQSSRKSTDSSFQNSYNSFSKNSYSFDSFDQYQNLPIVLDIIEANEKIYPYSPILISSNEKYLFLLDYHCSINILYGDINIIMQYLINQIIPDINSLPFQIIYKTIGNRQLNGECFAKVDKDGYLRVYTNSYFIITYIVWSSGDPNSNIDKFNLFDSTLYMDLSNTGELSIKFNDRSASNPICIWSTTNCNRFPISFINSIKNFIIIQNVNIKIRTYLTNIRKFIKYIIADFNEYMSDFYDAISDIFIDLDLHESLNDIIGICKEFFENIGLIK